MSSERASLRRFLKRATAFGLIQLAVVAVIVWQGSPAKSNHYYGAFQDKMSRMQQSPGRRLIVLGGSNVAFGIHSPQLQNATGLTPVNAGLHASLGLVHSMECVRHHGRSGDVVVLIPEYELLVSDLQQGDPNAIDQLVEQWPGSSRYFDRSQNRGWKEFLDRSALWTSHEWVARAVTAIRKGRRDDSVYQRASFNKYGDVVAHHGRAAGPRKPNQPLGAIDQERLQSSIALINQFARECEDRQIVVYFSYSPLPEESYSRSEDAIRKIHRSLRSNLDVPILEDPRTLVFPEDHFFDTEYHLTATAGAKRTHTLAVSLQRARAGDTQAKRDSESKWR